MIPKQFSIIGFLCLLCSLVTHSWAADSFVEQVSLLWEKGDKEEVLSIANKRILANNNDIAGLILQLEYQLAFLQLDKLPITADKLRVVGDGISTENFRKIWPIVRADLETIKIMVPLYPRKQLDIDREKAKLPGKPMTYMKLLKAIEDDGLL